MEKKVTSKALNNYKNTDFSQVYVSKLHGAAKKGRNYSYQVNLMTHAYYADHVRKALAESTKSVMMVSWKTPKGVSMRVINRE